MRNMQRFGAHWLLAAMLMALLGACSHAPSAQPVMFHASGKPAHLSDWHAITAQDGKLLLNTDVVPYDLNTPLFSDYAHKLRTIWMPKGVAAKYDAAQTFDFPVGTIITKTFYYPLPKGAARDAKSVARSYDQSRDFAGSGLDLTQVHLIETRVLVRRESGWAALPYVWNAEQTDAELARTGDTQSLELVADDGAREPFTYVVPNENQCAGCHGTDMKNPSLIAPIGPKARHLNRDYAYIDGRENQLAHLTRLGYLMGLPEATAVPRNADWHDAKQDLTARARAYLDINCGHCHNANGPANTTGLSLDIFTPLDRHLGLCKPPVAAGRGTGDHKVDIQPGKPDDSILPYRMNSSEPSVMMPEQGRSTIHREGVELIRAWIAAWQGNCDLAS